LLHPIGRFRRRSLSFAVRFAAVSGVGETITLFRPTGPKELALVRNSGFRRWPPRLPEQPIFYPVTSEEYAAQIARDWNAPASGIGYVTRFRVRREFINRYPMHTVGASIHTEWWIPAEDLNELNANIVGVIEVIAEFHKPSEPGGAPSGGSEASSGTSSATETPPSVT
jgi:hypothetical protein